MSPPLTLIVAATAKNGIGKNGGLPWPMLKKEMAYFARVTKRVPSAIQAATPAHGSSAQLKPAQNVVVMGRRTWESIPPKFRPLPGRTNMIISAREAGTFGSANEDVVVAQSVQSGLDYLARRGEEGLAKPMGRVFVIGGAQLYKTALELPSAKHILLTRVHEEYDCDTFFPVDVESAEWGWRKRSKDELEEFIGEDLEDAVLEETVKEQTVRYEFTLYERL